MLHDCRARRLKGIKNDAEEELAEYKDIQKRKFDQALSEKQAELDNMDQGEGGDSTAKALEAVQADFAANSEEVIKMLIGNVMNVNIEIPRVIKGNFDE